MANAKNVARSAPLKEHLQLAETRHIRKGNVTCCRSVYRIFYSTPVEETTFVEML